MGLFESKITIDCKFRGCIYYNNGCNHEAPEIAYVENGKGICYSAE